MNNSEKMLRAIGGIEDDLIEAADRCASHKTVFQSRWRWVSVAAAIVLLTVSVLALPKLTRQNRIRPGAPSSSEKGQTESEQSALPSSDVSSGQPDDASETPPTTDHSAFVKTEEEGLAEWHQKTVTFRLLDAFKADEKNQRFAILARPFIDYTFSYHGKTLQEYYSAMCNERNLPELLGQLRKEGNALKYGKALYETGTPEGEKWAKEWYEERIRFYGKELLDQYIVAGEFLQEKLEADLAASLKKSEATNAYYAALAAYIADLAANLPGAPATELPKSVQNGFVMYLTEEEFAAFTVPHLEAWSFDLFTTLSDDEAAAE